MIQPEWDPRAEPDQLAALARVAADMHHGRSAFEARVSELGGGFPGRGGGGRGGGELTPTEAGAEASLSGQADTAAAERKAWERELSRSLEHAYAAWARYRRVVEPATGVAKLADPGCELCAPVPDHWCPVYGVRVVLIESKNRKAKPEIRTYRLCEWCFTRTWESRMGRLPTFDEVTAHAEGRRVNWHGGTEPKLVEVSCPDCGDENRAARRKCTTCGHAGRVLKQV